MFSKGQEAGPQEPIQPERPSSWWSNKLGSILALVYLICAIITAVAFTPALILEGIIQILCALVILSIEAPVFVPCLGFARGIGSFIDRKPYWLKSVLYLSLSILPFIVAAPTTGITISVFFILGFLANVGIFVIYGRLVIGAKANRNQMHAHTGPAGGVFP